MAPRRYRPHKEDQRILETLFRNARITNRDLARELELPEHVASDRLRILQSNGILGTTVLLDYAAFGYRPCLNVRVDVVPGRREEVERFLLAIENAVTVYAFSAYAPSQFGVNLVARDLDDVQRLVAERMASCPGVRRWQVHITLGRTDSNPPFVFGDQPAGPHLPIEPHGDVDATDVAIIQAFRGQGRKPFLTVAEELGVVEGTVRRRVARMLDQRAIRFYPVVSRPGRPEVPSMSIIWIDVDAERSEAMSEALRAHPDFPGFARVFGPLGSFVTTCVASRTRHEEVLEQFLARLPGVRRLLVEPVEKILKLSDTWRDLTSTDLPPLDLLSAEGDTNGGPSSSEPSRAQPA